MNDKEKAIVGGFRYACKIPSYHNMIINKKAIRERATNFIFRTERKRK